MAPITSCFTSISFTGFTHFSSKKLEKSRDNFFKLPMCTSISRKDNRRVIIITMKYENTNGILIPNQLSKLTSNIYIFTTNETKSKAGRERQTARIIDFTPDIYINNKTKNR